MVSFRPRDIEKAASLRRPEPQLLSILATAPHELGNDPRAREILERSLSMEPRQPQAKELLDKLEAESPGERPRS